MASRYECIVIICLCFTLSCAVEVKWTVSLPRQCELNDTMLGVCARSRTVQCVKTKSGQRIPDYYCSGLSTTKPSPFIKCDAQKCPGRCVVSMWSPWQPCDSACSRSFAYRTRSVLWRDNDAVPCPARLEKAQCPQCAQNANEFYFWKVGDWGTCRLFATVTVYDLSANQSRVSPSGSDVCEPYLKLGKATRKVKCVDTTGVKQNARNCLNAKDKDGRITQRPDRSKICQFSCDCALSAWSAWSGCPGDCSRTEESRTRGILYPPQHGGKPCGSLIEKRACNARDCPQNVWFTSAWGQCEFSSNGSFYGNGFQERVVFCIESGAGRKTNDVQPVGEHSCDVVTRPVARQPCQTPCPQDCVVSEWSAWKPCSPSCGPARVKQRVRRVVHVASNGGQDCPSLVQMSPCEAKACASWRVGHWSGCFVTARCGLGMSTRLTFCSHMSGSWLMDSACSHIPQPRHTKNCTVPCPNDCALSNWANWGACSKSCGEQGGVQTRKRSILAYPSSIRSPCPKADELIETQKCNVGTLCENEASYMWKTTTWGPCNVHVNSTCGAGKGVKTREVHCGNVMKNFANDTLCLNMTKPVAKRPCDIPCPADCALSKWENWSKCNASCRSTGIQVSKRYVLQYADHGGLPCPANVSDGVEVKLRPCWSGQPCYNYTWSVTLWQDCQLLPQSKSTPPSCGAGYQTRNISCVRSDAKLVETSYCFEATLEAPPKAVKECWKPCDNHCVRTSWSEWSKCPNRCTRTAPYRDRSRQVVNLSPARGGFSATCPPLTALDFTETEDCPKIPCKRNHQVVMHLMIPIRMKQTVVDDFCYKWYPDSYGSCIPYDGTTSCGDGRKERNVLCQDQSDLSFVAGSFCDQSKKPMSWESCLVPCTQDCVVSAWGDWDQKCSENCGDWLRSRRRSVLKAAVGLGRACPSQVEKQLCREPACTSFKWSVGTWSTCRLASNASACGNGTQVRDVTCSPDPAREWICAGRAPKPAVLQDCSLPCPGDCVMDMWSSWSECVLDKNGECVHHRWRITVRKEHMTSTKKCGGYFEQETSNCSCPVPVKIVSGEWSTCQLNQMMGRDYGKGMQYRSVNCEDHNGTIVDNKDCPSIDATPRSRDCEIPCPIDCVVGHWGEWSSCAGACGLKGNSRRSRKVVIAEQNGGRKCPDTQQYRPCGGVPCYGYSLERGAWSKCYVDGQGCGEGSQIRDTTCRRSDGGIVSLHFCFGQLKNSDDSVRLKVLQDVINNSSEISLTSTRSCDVSCPGDCFMSDWSEWSECGTNCFENSTKYYQTRSRVVISSPDAGGKACPSDLVRTKTCQPTMMADRCLGARWKTGAWRANNTRAVWCETSSGVRVTGACASQRKPSDAKSCKPACSDPNSICDEGQCLCKPHFESFQSRCIPTRGCLHDGHCINPYTVCTNQTCTCKMDYIWNSTTSSCVLLQKPTTDQPRMTTAIPTKETTTKISTAIPPKETTTKISTLTTIDTTRKPSSTKIVEIVDIVERTSTDEVKPTSPTDDHISAKKHLDEDKISPGFWKWIGIGVGALILFLVLAIGFYCYTTRQRKAKHKMMKLKRNTIELVGVMTFEEGGKSKPEKV